MYQPGEKRRFNNKCRTCGAFFTALACAAKDSSGKWAYRDVEVPYEDGVEGKFYPHAPSDPYRLWYTCACGQKRGAKAVVGKLNRNIKCNAKCTSATGHQCECSCGGKNHGAH